VNWTGATIGNGSRGPITERFQGMYFDAVRGRRAQNADWLTPVA
jgi:branched-chain amino acid aminotransferase